MEKINSYKLSKKQIIIFAILLVSASSFIIMSPCAIGSNASSGTDSSVFRYIGKAMAMGQLPYKDVFDHKGILLYFINMIGYLIDPNWGIWIIELFTVFTAMTFSYLTFNKLINNSFLSLAGSVFSYCLLSEYYQKGNLSEEYFMPFISIALYFFICYFLDKRNLYFGSFISGICFACVILIRPNGIGTWVTFCCFIFIDLIMKKKWVELARYAGSFISGTLLCLLPFLMYLTINDIFHDFYYSYIVFNFKYIDANFTLNSFIGAIYAIFNKGYIPFVILCCALLSIMYNNKSSIQYKLFVLSVINLVVNAYFICMSGRNFGHYGMTIIPSLTVVSGLLVFFLLEYLKDKKVQKEIAGIVVMLIIYIVSMDYPIPQQFNDNWKAYSDNHFKSSENKKIIKLIERNSTEKDKICVIGNNCNIYLDSNRQACTKYIYQDPIAKYDNRVMETLLKDVKKEVPKVIVVYKSRYETIKGLCGELDKYISSSYEAVYQDKSYIIYSYTK